MKVKKIAIFLALTTAYLFCPAKTRADTVLFSDNFSDGDFSDWTVQRNKQWSNSSQPCYYQSSPTSWQLKDGELGMMIHGSGCVTEITPNNLDLSGKSFSYTFDWNFKESTHMDRTALFLWKDTNNWYDFKILDDSISLQKVVGGSATGLSGGSAYYPFAGDQKYNFEIIFLNHEQISLKINGQPVLTAIDQAPFIDGFTTIGLQAGSGAIVRSVSFFDNIVVRSLNEPEVESLNVSLLKQTDPLWANQEYDSATKWSTKPTISRWGCALTSMAMIMQHYGMNTLPNGQALTPDTLNQWLKSQTDGYLGEGNLNWMAVTRLTRLISDQLNTPKLEYRRFDGSSLDKAITEIKNKKPVILQIAGHFLAGDGVTTDQTDVLIKDPAYNLQKFSQHQTSLISTRTFQPSQTDLSYLLMTHQPGLSVELLDDQDHILDWETFSESLTDPIDDSGESTAELTVHQLTQPSTGTYYLKVSQASLGDFSFQLFAYDAAGNPSPLHQEGTVGSEPITYRIEYSKDGLSLSHRTAVTWASLRKDLQMTQDQDHFLQPFVYTLLNRLTLAAQRLPNQQQSDFAQMLLKQLEVHQDAITTEAKAYLTQQLQALISDLNS